MSHDLGTQACPTLERPLHVHEDAVSCTHPRFQDGKFRECKERALDFNMAWKLVSAFLPEVIGPVIIRP